MASVNLDTSTRLDITCRRGDTFELTLTLKDGSGTALPLVTDDYKFLMQVRAPRARASSLQAQRLARPLRRALAVTNGGGGEVDPEKEYGEDGVASVDGVLIGSAELGKKGAVNFSFNNVDNNGNVTVFLSALDMAKIKAGRYKYDFQYKTGTTEKTLLEGSFKVNDDVSKSVG